MARRARSPHPRTWLAWCAVVWASLASAAVGSACRDSKACIGDKCPDGGAAGSAPPLSDATVHAVNAAEACSSTSVHAMRGPSRPVDVIFVIDNSGSMSEEIAAVRDNINRDFAAIIAESGVDYRVIMISKYGLDSLSVCVEPPLAQADCDLGIDRTNSTVFYHYDQEIGSTDALCQILTTFDRPDARGRAPAGWQAWLRPDSHKAFVVITDDSPLCMYGQGETPLTFGQTGVDPFEDALQFHRALLTRSGAQFGVPPDVKYQFFSIIGLAAGPVPGEPYFPHQGIVHTTCDSAPGPGPTYQALSIVTDSLRYPVCEGRSFDAVFRVLAKNVIQASQADCEFAIPEAPPDQAFLLDSVNLEYRSGGDGSAQRFTQVKAAAGCGTKPAFYIDDRIRLCPTACSLVKKDPTPEVQILFGCTGIPQ
jgi:hypothetical protein